MPSDYGGEVEAEFWVQCPTTWDESVCLAALTFLSCCTLWATIPPEARLMPASCMQIIITLKRCVN